MSKSSRRSSGAAVLASTTLLFAAPAVAVPAAVPHAALAPTIRARPIASHVSLAGPRTTAHALVVHYAAPLPLVLRPAPVAPIKALPLGVPPTPVRALPALLPRLGLAALPALAGTDRCASSRSGVILSTLPSAPFPPIACERDLSAQSLRDLPTSLVPGHNKNALYGRAYAPRSSDDP